MVCYLFDVDALDDHEIADEDDPQDHHQNRANSEPNDVLGRQGSFHPYRKDGHYDDRNDQPGHQQQQRRKQHFSPDNLLHKILIFR